MQLNRSLAANAAFSTACGLFLLVAPDRVGEWLGVEASLVIRAVGAGLLLLGIWQLGGILDVHRARESGVYGHDVETWVPVDADRMWAVVSDLGGIHAFMPSLQSSELVHEMTGGWEVEPDGTGCTVRVWWRLRPRPRFMAPLILPVLGLRVDREFPGIIRRMADAA